MSLTNHEIAWEIVKLADAKEMSSLYKENHPSRQTDSYAMFLADVFVNILTKLPEQNVPEVHE